TGLQYWWRLTAHNYAGDSPTTTRTFTNSVLTNDCTSDSGTGNGTVFPFYRNHIDDCKVSSIAVPNWFLWDVSRQSGQPATWHPAGQMPSTSVIQTRKYNTATTSETVSDLGADNYWGDSTQGSAVDAHVNAGLFYDYLLSTHSINSYDGLGASMVSLVD